MENIISNEIDFSHIGTSVYYKLTNEESRENWNQKIAPAIILAGWLNEYSQEEHPEKRVGLNILVFGMNGAFPKLSVKRGDTFPPKSNPREEPLINEGEYFHGGFLTVPTI